MLAGFLCSDTQCIAWNLSERVPCFARETSASVSTELAVTTGQLAEQQPQDRDMFAHAGIKNEPKLLIFRWWDLSAHDVCALGVMLPTLPKLSMPFKLFRMFGVMFGDALGRACLLYRCPNM